MRPSNYKTKVRFNCDIHGRKEGAVEPVKTDKNGVILDPLIRRRLKDNDGSVEIVGKTKETETKTVRNNRPASQTGTGDNK